jgi:hypothetical protein
MDTSRDRIVNLPQEILVDLYRVFFSGWILSQGHGDTPLAQKYREVMDLLLSFQQISADEAIAMELAILTLEPYLKDALALVGVEFSGLETKH